MNFTDLNIFFRCISHLWISHFETPISYPQQPSRHFIFELSLGLRMVLKCPPYSVLPGDQLSTYPVTFSKLNKRKEKLLSQTSALKFLFHACKFLTLLTIAKLRWLITVSSNFQDVYFDGSLLPLFITWCHNHGIKKLPNHRWTRWYYFRDTIDYHSNTMTCWKHP